MTDKWALKAANIRSRFTPTALYSAQIQLLCKGKIHPITVALRGLCAKIHNECEGKGVGAIGMCFTGGFVLTMMLEPSLLAPVTAQPSLPFFSRCALDVDMGTLSQITKRSDDAVLLGLRFEHDKISLKERMDRMRQVFSGITPASFLRFECIEVSRQRPYHARAFIYYVET